MWEDSSYCWVVTCKNHIYHIPRNFIDRHKIPLAETDAVTLALLSRCPSKFAAIAVARSTSISLPMCSGLKSSFPKGS